MICDLPANMRDKIAETPCPVPGLRGPCWTWTRAVQSRGYGSVGYRGKTWSTHKLAYELLVGPIPDGLQIDHLCRNKRCCNPGHLEPVTGKVNVGRTVEATKTHCVHGHPLAGANLRIKPKPNGNVQRQCRVCDIDMRVRRGERAGVVSTLRSAARRDLKRRQLIASGEAALAAAEQVAS